MKYFIVLKVLVLLLLAGSGSASSDLYAQETIDADALNHFHRGVFFYKNGHLLASSYEFEKLIELNPNIAGAHYNLGVIAHQQQNFNRAEKYYRRSASLNPDNAECHTNLGLIYLQKEKYDKALEHLKLAAILNPENANNYYRLAAAYRNIGERDLADSAYAMSIELNPNLESEHWSPELVNADDDYLEPLKELMMDKPEGIITDNSRFFRIVNKMNVNDMYFSRKFQVGFSWGPSFPENHYYKRLSESPDRLSFSGYIGLVLPRDGTDFLGAFGGDGYGFALKGRYTEKSAGSHEWIEISVAANLRFYENIDSRGRGKFFVAFGPGLYMIDSRVGGEETDNAQIGIEGGAGFDYMVLPFISVFVEGTYAFTYHGEDDYTNSLGYVHFGSALRF